VPPTRRGAGRVARVPGADTMFVAYWRRLDETFGWRFILILLSVYFVVKGMMSTLTSLAFQPYMRSVLGWVGGGGEGAGGDLAAAATACVRVGVWGN